jgi:hypothetical protein
MADYQVEIDGASELSQINLQIAGEEAGASQFVDSVPGTREGRVSNVVTFTELAPGTVPPPLTIAKQVDPPPQGKRRVWTGVMVLAGTLQAVIGYR